MFDLENEISAWRRALEQTGAFSTDDADELENHLRDRVAALTSKGVGEKEAFGAALDRLGSMVDLEDEYRKVRLGRTKRMATVTGAMGREFLLARSYLKTTLRSLKRNPGYSCINVVGLAVGMAACLLIGLYAQDELSVDRFHENADRIALITTEGGAAITPYPLAEAIDADLPEVERAVLFETQLDVPVTFDAGEIYLRVLLADSSFFQTFTYPLVSGTPGAAIDEPHEIVLTENAAERLFGARDPIGNVVEVDLYNELRSLIVSDVAEAPDRRSTLRFDAVVSRDLLPDEYPQEGAWGAFMYDTFVLFDRPESMVGFADRAEAAIRKRVDGAARPRFTALPLTDVYMSRHHGGTGFSAEWRYLYLFSTFALLMFLIASVNYVNLSTALAMRRTREVGVRKSLGADRRQLVRQFLMESILISVAALVLAVVLSAAVLPSFNNLFGKELALSFDLFFASLCVSTVLAGIAAGAYPALLLSRLRATEIFTGKARLPVRGRGRVRQGLIIFQFAVSVALIVGTAVIYRQIDYVQSVDLGFEAEQVVMVNLPGGANWTLRTQTGEMAAAHTAVQSATVVEGAPSDVGVRLGRSSGSMSTEAPDSMITFIPAVVDVHYVRTLGLKMLAGRDFAASRASDRDLSYILNRSAAVAFGWAPEEAVGKPFRTDDDAPMGSVIGVVEDHHTHSLKEPILPVAMQLWDDPNWSSSPKLLARMSPGAVQSAVEHLRDVFERVAPDVPFTYEFLDDRFDALYESENDLARIVAGFASLAVLLACVGLVALSAHAAKSRTKEIGIRKALGATVSDIILLLTRGHLTLVFVGFVIAIPIAMVITTRWLEEFAYRIDVGPGLILVVGMGTLVLAVTAVIIQTARAAGADPVESLRYE